MKRFAAWIFALIVFVAITYLCIPAAYAKDLTCKKLDDCIAETLRILPDREGKDYQNTYHSEDVSKAFSQFGQQGFDALFDLAKHNQAQDLEFLFQALCGVQQSRKDKIKVTISDTQYDTLIDRWNTSPDYSLICLINSADTPRSHSFIIKALQDSDKDKRNWVEQIFWRNNLGNSDTPVDAKHLGEIMKLIKTTEYRGVLDILERIEGDEAEEAIWSTLETKSKVQFSGIFDILKKRDSNRVYEEIKNLSFEETPQDRARAVMIASVIKHKQRKNLPIERHFSYWKYWYDAEDSNATKRLIPTYMLFDFHEKTKAKIKNIERDLKIHRQLLNEAQEKLKTASNPQRQAKSIKYLEREINKYSGLPAILNATTNFLTADEMETSKNYFQIFEALNQGDQIERYNGGLLPFKSLLDDTIQTPTLWTNGFLSHLNCGPDTNNFHLIKQIADLDPEHPQLKSCLKTQLENGDNIPKVMETLTIITRSDPLRRDPEIRKAVSKVDNNTPFTSLRAIQQFTLSDGTSPGRYHPGIYLQDDPRRELMEEHNRNQTYCEVKTKGEFDYLDSPPLFRKPSITGYGYPGAPIMTVKTPSGYLTGHNQGEFGGGMFYYSDEDSDAIDLDDDNLIAIIQSETDGIYWAVSGLNHMLPGKGTITKIDARTDDVKTEWHKTMPIVTRNVTPLKNGDLFMDFWREYDSYDEEDKIDHNPPVILTKSGELISGCGN